MPTYSFRCMDCGQEWDEFLRFEDANKFPPCPECKSTDTARVLTAPMVICRHSPGHEEAMSCPTCGGAGRGRAS